MAKRREGYAVVVLGFRPEDAARYGRLVVNNGELEKIVEFKDASDEEKAITLCNSGVMCFDGSLMFDILREIGNENAAHEYYLTDAVAIARARGLKCGVVECPAEEVAGANTREELALLEQYLNEKRRKVKFMRFVKDHWFGLLVSIFVFFFLLRACPCAGGAASG